MSEGKNHPKTWKCYLDHWTLFGIFRVLSWCHRKQNYKIQVMCSTFVCFVGTRNAGLRATKKESAAFSHSILWEKTTVLNLLQSFAGIAPGTCLFMPLSLTSLSLASISQVLGGTSTAGEQLKNPCGFKHEHKQKNDQKSSGWIQM